MTVLEKTDEEAAERLQEIHDEMVELLRESYGLLPYGFVKDRAKAYWYAHIKMALNDDHDYLGGGSHTIADTIGELKGEEDEEDGGE